MRADYNLEYWLDQLRKEIIKKLTGTTDDKNMVKNHYDMLCGALNISRRTAERFLRHQDSVSITSRNLFAAYALHGNDDLKINLESETDYFIAFIEFNKSKTTERTSQEPTSVNGVNWKGDQKDLFMVYEVAFLWHGQEPPAAAYHAFYMTRKVEETKDMLHEAINSKRLKVAKEVLFENGGYTRWVSREDLKVFAKTLNLYPDFLFPAKE